MRGGGEFSTKNQRGGVFDDDELFSIYIYIFSHQGKFFATGHPEPRISYFKKAQKGGFWRIEKPIVFFKAGGEGRGEGFYIWCCVYGICGGGRLRTRGGFFFQGFLAGGVLGAVGK